ncbi:MAG TPA: dephospho-CoA kinase [Bacteroidales bacterium]|nr:dephospho-CoA kinase [Bacteroidales bacterium]HOK99403.1 dephospho-CoA kinase [Bacteroidales bacterium]HPO66273.1 dephospho-CoA kinase [Bacteroidales bacterium]
MLKVGLTGGIGSGKSTIAEVFRILGIPVFVADEEAKYLLNDDGVIDFYRRTIGDAIVTEKGIDKKKTAAILFQRPELVEKINAFIHPLVEKRFEEWCKQHTNLPYVIKESAILFETGLYKKLDYNVLVTAPRELRIERLKRARQMQDDEIEKRMQHQWSDEAKAKLANWVIRNDNQHAVLPQVIAIHQQLINYNSRIHN